MWWIAACLGALVWLLAVRIRLKEKERSTQREERLLQSEKAARAVFVQEGFLPVARRCLEELPEAEGVLLLFAHLEWPHKPAEVHMEVVPVTKLEGLWPAQAEHGLWMTKEGDGLHFAPPQAHWERLSGLESWLNKLTCFADVGPPVPAEQATLADYRVYARLRRTSESAQLEVVGEPNSPI